MTVAHQQRIESENWTERALFNNNGRNRARGRHACTPNATPMIHHELLFFICLQGTAGLMPLAAMREQPSALFCRSPSTFVTVDYVVTPITTSFQTPHRTGNITPDNDDHTIATIELILLNGQPEH